MRVSGAWNGKREGGKRVSVKAVAVMMDGTEITTLKTGWADVVIWITEHWKDLKSVSAEKIEIDAFRQGRNK